MSCGPRWTQLPWSGISGASCALSGVSSTSSPPYLGPQRATPQLLPSLTFCSSTKYRFDLKWVLLVSSFGKWRDWGTPRNNDIMQLIDPRFKAMLIALTDSLLLENWSVLSEIVVWFFLTAQSILFLDCRYHGFVLLTGASGNIQLSMNDVWGKLIGGKFSALSREL